MAKRMQRAGSFMAKGEDGDECVVHIFVDVIQTGSLDHPDIWSPGRQRLMTGDGEHVERIEKGKYQLIRTGEILTSDDSKAV